MLFTTRSTTPSPSAPPSSHTSCIGYFACCRVSLVSSSLLFLLLLMSSLWQRDRCPLSPLPAPPPPPLALSYCLALPVLFHFLFFFFVFFTFHSLFALAPFDSPKMKRQSARCDNRHTFEFYWLACHTSISHTHSHTHTKQTTTMRMPKKANKSSCRRSKNKAVERCQRDGRMISFLMPYREIWDDSQISSRYWWF